MSVTINHQTNSVEPSSGDLSIGGSGNVSINNEAIVDGDVTIDNRNRLRFADAGVDKSLIGLNQGKYLYMGSEGTNSDPRIRFDGEATQAAIVPTLPGGATTSGASGYLNLGSSTAGFKDLYLDGGVYLGGDGSANYLDDYEEGTWTPVLSGYTGVGYTSQTGKYTKVGNLVIAEFQLHIASIGTYSGNSRITGWPFPASAAINQNVGQIRIGLNSATTINANTTSLYIGIYNNSSDAFLYSQTGGTYNGNVWQAGIVAATAVYRTNS